MSPTIDSLKREHRAIEAVIRALGEVCQGMQHGETADPTLLDQFIDFIRRFADGCHHQKEEQLLFPAMVQRGFPADVGPIGCMLSEHERGRAFVRRMVAAVDRLRAGDTAAGEEFASAAAGYGELLTEHIYKEDNVLFVMAENVVGSEALSGLEQSFGAAETSLGPGRYEEYRAWAHSLAPVAAER